MQNLDFILTLPKTMFAIHGSFWLCLDHPDFRNWKKRSEYEDIDICVESWYENALISLAKTFEINWKIDFDWVEIDRWPYDAPDFQITMIKFPDWSKIDFHDMENIQSLQKSKDWFYIKSIIDIAKWKLKAMKEWTEKKELYWKDILWMLECWFLNLAS
jgi:hypothetical protein